MSVGLRVNKRIEIIDTVSSPSNVSVSIDNRPIMNDLTEYINWVRKNLTMVSGSIIWVDGKS